METNNFHWMLCLAGNITSDPSHILFEEYQLLPSHRGFSIPQARLNRLRNSFVPQSVKLSLGSIGLSVPV